MTNIDCWAKDKYISNGLLGSRQQSNEVMQRAQPKVLTAKTVLDYVPHPPPGCHVWYLAKMASPFHTKF